MLNRLMLIMLVFLGLAQGALAFDKCSELMVAGSKLGRDMGTMAILKSPAKYIETMQSIRLVTTAPGESFMPFSTVQQGVKFVVMPLQFTKTACEIVLAQFLATETGDETLLDQAAATAGQCLDRGESQQKCVVGFGADLAQRYAKSWNALTQENQIVAYNILNSTMQEILMHEYGHHLLAHLERINARKVTRIDAEFEADLFAMTNGIISGDVSSAMYYFFNSLRLIEGHTKKTSTSDYESGTCRTANAETITEVFGVIPMLLIDAAYGGGISFSRNSPARVRDYAKIHFREEPPRLASESCAKIAGVALGTAYNELRQLYERMDGDLEFLFIKENRGDVARAIRLLGDLSAMTKRFQYMNGIAAKIMSLLLLRRGHEGSALAPLMSEIDGLLATTGATDDFLNEDLGRILQAQGSAVLQERTDLPRTPRLEKAHSLLQRAVSYNAALSDSWMNLAIIALEQGDCAAAARFGDRSLETLTSEDLHESIASFVRSMKQLSSDPMGCKAKAAQFTPYEGL